MHYGSYDFAIDRSKPTITSINGKKTKGTVFTQVFFTLKSVTKNIEKIILSVN